METGVAGIEPGTFDATAYERTDLGNAEAFASRHADKLRFVKDRKRWLVWHKGRWRLDESGAAERAAKETVRSLMRAALELEGNEGQKAAIKWALRSQAEQRVRALLALASTERAIVLTSSQLDHDPFLLSCANGTIDLRTGYLRPHEPGDLISLGNEIVYDPNATCPRWLQFLDEVFASDVELVSFVRRAVGYSLTGDTREHAFFMLYGPGANGKTTFTEIVGRLVGGLARTASFDSFVRARGDRPLRNDIARLHRARLVSASESGEGRRLDEALVKEITGGDTITARFLYGEHFEFRPEFNLWLRTNALPRVDGSDDAIWRRIRQIPFAISFEGREDRELPARLEAELPGILTWAVFGCLEWQEKGLGLPFAVQDATRTYRQSEDVLGMFLDERCARELTASVSVPDLREAYENYCKGLGETPLAASVLGRRLAKAEIRSTTDGRERRYEGLRLK